MNTPAPAAVWTVARVDGRIIAAGSDAAAAWSGAEQRIGESRARLEARGFICRLTPCAECPPALRGSLETLATKPPHMPWVAWWFDVRASLAEWWPYAALGLGFALLIGLLAYFTRF